MSYDSMYDSLSIFHELSNRKSFKINNRRYSVLVSREDSSGRKWHYLHNKKENINISEGNFTILAGCCSAAQWHVSYMPFSVEVIQDIVTFMGNCGINVLHVSMKEDDSQKLMIERFHQAGFIDAYRAPCTRSIRDREAGTHMLHMVHILELDDERLIPGYCNEEELFGGGDDK